MSDGVLTREVVKRFNTITALDNVSVSIPKGRIVGLLGSNGAGKTTFMRLLSGILQMNSGEAMVHGLSLDEDLDSVKRITGILPEEAALYEKLTIMEYVQFIGALYDVSEDEISRRFSIFAERLSLTPLQYRLIETLSKGQKQKVALIASLIHDPEVLLLDEPMANLDVVAQKEVKKIIREYSHEGRTIIIATHLLDNVKDLCDFIVILDRGKVIYQGELNEFLSGHDNIEEAYLTKFLVV